MNKIPALVLTFAAGLGAGWFLFGSASKRDSVGNAQTHSDGINEPLGIDGTGLGSGRSSGSSNAEVEPKRSPFGDPQTEADHAKVISTCRLAFETNPKFPARMIAVADLVDQMTEANADTMREAIEASWAAGYNYDWERSLFLARYAEIMGVKAVEEYKDVKRIDRDDYMTWKIAWGAPALCEYYLRTGDESVMHLINL